jgi:hypothetical protein
MKKTILAAGLVSVAALGAAQAQVLTVAGFGG